MSTDPRETTFQRDMQWGQALQLVEDLQATDGTQPVPFRVEKGEKIAVIVRYAEDRVVLQFALEHLPEAVGNGTGPGAAGAAGAGADPG